MQEGKDIDAAAESDKRQAGEELGLVVPVTKTNPDKRKEKKPEKAASIASGQHCGSSDSEHEQAGVPSAETDDKGESRFQDD